MLSKAAEVRVRFVNNQAKSEACPNFDNTVNQYFKERDTLSIGLLSTLEAQNQ